MKLFVSFSLILLGIAQFNWAQSSNRAPLLGLNSMSNVVGITGEGGITLPYTDYRDIKTNWAGKASLEYYFPSHGKGNFGLRIFGQTGFIAGKGAPTYPAPSVGNPTDEFSTKIDLLGGGVMYMLSLKDAVFPWVGLGMSNIWFDPKNGNEVQLPNNVRGGYNKFMMAFNGDLGVRIMVSKHISVNIAGGVIVGKKDYLDDIMTGSNNDMFYTATVGLTFYIGRLKDSDGDGVPDSRDLCPGTPIGVKVDADGCPLDADGDGVPDYLDKCPNTPAGVKVDATGCPLDADGDGVPDYLDKCPNTPAGVAVDANGCPLDSDGDGVPDYLDKCPNTPTGVQVDADGCPIKKETVIIVQPKETESLVLSGDTNFEFNKAVLLPNAYPVLDSLVGTMMRHHDYKWEIGGHTDGIGSVNYNVKLSQRRAQSVIDYLVSKGVDRKNLKAVGYGKSTPIATNDTPEGRSMNRRVEIKVISKDSK